MSIVEANTPAAQVIPGNRPRSKLLRGAVAVRMDEPCWSVKEMNEQSPGSKGFHRYQVITVVRNGGEFWELRRDLGRARRFKADQFCVPGGIMDTTTGRIEILHTVGELVDIAEWLRDPKYADDDPPQPYDLVKGYYDSFDKKALRRRRRSMVGPLVRVQRE